MDQHTSIGSARSDNDASASGANLIEPKCQRTSLHSHQFRGFPVSLKFPNARLLMHELLSAERLSGPQAIALGACQFGLISSEAMADVIADKGGNNCQCLSTAKNVIQQYFDQGDKKALSVDTEEVWSAIEKQLSKSFPQEDGHAACNEEHAGAANHCSRHVPVLIDLMLQQITRYS
jgi:hypothetical protein